MPTVRILDDLVGWLQNRAERHVRTVSGEVNSILRAQKAQDAEEGKVTESLPAGPIVVSNKGPLPTLSGYRGVYPYGKRWVARRMHQGSLLRIGVFDDPQEAAQAYDDWLRANVHNADPTSTAFNFPRKGEEKVQTDDDSSPMTREAWQAAFEDLPGEKIRGLPPGYGSPKPEDEDSILLEPASNDPRKGDINGNEAS